MVTKIFFFNFFQQKWFYSNEPHGPSHGRVFFSQTWSNSCIRMTLGLTLRPKNLNISHFFRLLIFLWKIVKDSKRIKFIIFVKFSSERFENKFVEFMEISLFFLYKYFREIKKFQKIQKSQVIEYPPSSFVRPIRYGIFIVKHSLGFLWRRFLEGSKILHKIWPLKWFFRTPIFISFENLGM